MKIAVTGGMGSGKTTVSRMLAYGLETALVSSDEICRELLQPGADGLVQFVKLFGGRFLLPDDSLDRKRLREAVFTDGAVKKNLEDILHPLVRKRVEEIYSNPATGEELVVEVPLLFEVGWQDDFDTTVVVRLSPVVCRERVVLRDGLAHSEIMQIMDSQLPLEVKLSLADHTIDNSGTMASTMQQVGWLQRQLMAARKERSRTMSRK